MTTFSGGRRNRAGAGVLDIGFDAGRRFTRLGSSPSPTSRAEPGTRSHGPDLFDGDSLDGLERFGVQVLETAT